MAYWWVSQNQTFKQERAGDFLWAPDQTEAGLTPFHWATMNEVRAGNVVFSYVGGKLVSVAVAKTAAYDSIRPSDLGEGMWEDAGKKIEVEYRDLPVQLVIAGVVPELQPLLPERYSPLTRFGTGNQGYLFALPPRVGRFLLERIGVEQSDILRDPVVEGIVRVVKDATERRALVTSRIGQGQFREALMGFWGGRCAVTGLDLPPLLRASHIKPWRDSNNHERLDPFNGLLLSPSYDAAFDSGHIAFTDDGEVIVSAELTSTRVGLLGISQAACITGLHESHRAYLEHHRRNVFTA
jgi:putative restriction endonuclease